MSIVKWATELAESLGKPEAAKFIYDWAKTSGNKIPNAAETERLSRAVGEGFNAVGYRYSANPAKDEQHLQKMLLDPKRLADENRAFHVDITPGAPAARTRAFNVTGDPGVFEPGYADVRPLALRLENVVRGSDEQANATRFLTEALKRNSTGVRYTPVEGELSGPARNVDSPFYTLAKSSGSNYQPSVAMIDPTAVRDLRTAAFTPRTKAALAAAVAAGATPLLQAKEAAPMPFDQVRATPRNSALGAVADFLAKSYSPERTQQMQGVAKFLGMPAVSETIDRLSYDPSGRSLFTGAGGLGGTTRFRPEVLDAAMAVAPMVGPLAQVTGKVGKAGARVLGEELNRAILDSSGPLAKLIPPAVKPMYIVPPQGNLNLTPISRAEILKGPNVQNPESFLNQLRGKPGMTQEGFDDLVKQYQGLEPGTRMTKADFEQRIPASRYNKVDLANSAESADAHLLEQANEMVMDDRYNVYEYMLDRFGIGVNRGNLNMLDEYHANNLTFEQLSPELQRGLTRVGATTPDSMNVLDDIFAEERDNAVNNTFQTLREQDFAYSGLEPGGYAYRDYQRLLENPVASESGYFELGVSHPDQMVSYKHYPGHGGEEGLIGHVRGTFISADAPDEARQLINPLRFKRIPESDKAMLAKPNSMVIEEIQSDAQKGKAQTGALRQAHGTVFKAAIQHALENGADTVYYPTSEIISHVRSKASSAYAPIYDQQIVNEGLKPLLRIPGVNSSKIGDAYHEITFTPEAKDFILKGEGQTAPGMAQGGAVHMGIGGLLKLKNAVKGAQKVLPAAERDANLAKMLESSNVKERLYHGTGRDIRKFDKSKLRRTAFGEGFHLAESPNLANFYANQFDEGQNVMPVYAAIKNPYELKSMHDWYDIPGANDTEKTNLLKSQGYDGIKYPHGAGDDKTSPSPNVYVAFEPEQIKSATGNRGTYDTSNPDISKAKGGGVHFDEGGAAFGVFPQMKPRRAQQDRTAAANAPLSALRGYAAGTAGLPGDIEGLARAGISQLPPQLLTAFPALRAFGIGSRADPTPQMPTTEFYNEYLPGAQLNATPTGKTFTTAGNLFGGAGSTTLARYGIKSAKATAKAIAEAAPGPASGSRAAQLGVIKMPGGNWLKHSVEDAVKPMKSQPPAISGEIIDDIAGTQLFDDYRKFYDAGNETVGLRQWVEKNHPDVYKQLVGEQGTVLNNFIDKKIAPYIRNEMATPDDPLRAMAEKYAVDKPVKLAEVQARIDAFAAKMEQTARDRGVPVEQLTSMRQQMIGLEKEKALVEAREGLHFNPDEAIDFKTKDARKGAGFPMEGVGISPAAQAWEISADNAINAAPASQHTRQLTASEIRGGFRSTVDADPWLLKVPPETQVHYPERGFPESTGFNHLIDELRNAINPASGLPANLLIDPADLGKLTMPQAVDRVADINAWRATQKAEANLLTANNAATQVVKEYPEQGLKWVELKVPKDATELPSTHQLEPYESKVHGGTGYRVVNKETGMKGEGYKTPERATSEYLKEHSKEKLEDALKYEGDTMQHCVGGYCPDVVEGRSRIYSLRDSKGQPRVTIEVKPHEGWFTKADGMPDPSGKNKSFHQLIDNERSELARQKGGFGNIGESYEDTANRFANQYGLKTDPTITQIKGFKNKKPADEYLPMVQDFVKSGNWSDVRDLRNADMRRTLDAFNSNELKMIQDAGLEVPTWASGEDIQRLHNSIVPAGKRLKYDSRGHIVGMEQGDYLDPAEYAHGGFVSNHFDPIKIKQIIAGLDDEYDPENIQQIIAQRESAYA